MADDITKSCSRRWTPSARTARSRHVVTGVNPKGVRVESFKVPCARELDQD
jgi:hypothetical protein